MHICLSSGSRPQYAHDVLRAIALPEGATLQFRYRLSWLSANVNGELSKGSVLNTKTLIAYIDQSNPGSKPEIIPVRFATIRAANIHGSFVTLQLEVGRFATATDVTRFNSQLAATSNGSEPVWLNGKVSGKYWFTFEPAGTLVETTPEAQIEALTQILGSRKDFEHENVFYTILGIYDSATSSRIPVSDGEFRLDANHAYSARLLYMCPRDDETTSIIVASSSPLLTIVSNPNLQFSSRYDAREVSFTTGRPEVGLHLIRDNAEKKASRWPRSALSFSHSSKLNSEPSDLRWDFDLRIAVNPDIGRALLSGVAVGVLASTPAMVPLAVTDKASTGTVAAVLVLGAIAGICAVFGLKRPT